MPSGGAAHHISFSASVPQASRLLSSLRPRLTLYCPALCCAAGATGGFAGGEAGLKQYVATGEIKLRDPNQPTQRQTSPVAVAGLLIAAGAGGGLLLNELTDVGEGALKAEILNVSKRAALQCACLDFMPALLMCWRSCRTDQTLVTTGWLVMCSSGHGAADAVLTLTRAAAAAVCVSLLPDPSIIPPGSH